MNKFDATQIKASAKYLQEQLDLIQNNKEISNEKIFNIEKKKESSLKRLVNSFFK